MARITVEDCLDHVDNRFELVLLATKRARQLSFGTAEPFVPWENDKPTVVALREIADGLINEQVIKDAQARAEPDVIETDIEVNAFEGSIDLTTDFGLASGTVDPSPAPAEAPVEAPAETPVDISSEAPLQAAAPESPAADDAQED